jgi:hypothetical protein
VSTALERNSMDQNYSFYENMNILNLKNSLKFHPVCGKNIQFSDAVLHGKRRIIAERNEKSFCDGIVFSEKPIELYERVFIRILKLSSCWNGMIRFGFTAVDPQSLSTVLGKNSRDIYTQKIFV